MLRALLLVGLGGFFGSISRYLVKVIMDKYVSVAFPYATLSANLIGCFLIGLLFGWLQRGNIQGNTWLILATGFCGAFTTFSTFALENNILLDNKQTMTAIVYMGISLIAGLLLCKLGIIMTR